MRILQRHLALHGRLGQAADRRNQTPGHQRGQPAGSHSDDRFSARYRYRVEGTRESDRVLAGELSLEIVFRREGTEYTTCTAPGCIVPRSHTTVFAWTRAHTPTPFPFTPETNVNPACNASLIFTSSAVDGPPWS